MAAATMVAATMVAKMTERREEHRPADLAPVEPGTATPAAEMRRPDPKPLQRAWSAAGAAASSALLAMIVGPMVASGTNGGFTLDGQGASATTPDGTSVDAVPTPNYVYLQPGESAPVGAPVVQLDPISVVGSPLPGSTLIQPKPKRKIVYIYLQPGQTPPPGAIVQNAGSVGVVTPPPAPTTAPTSGGGSGSGGSGGGSATPKPVTQPPVSTPKPVPVPVAPPTKTSGAAP